MSFKKKDTIKKKNEIRNVIYSGERITSHYIDIFYLEKQKNRMAVLNGRANRNAVDRNKIKRRIREIYKSVKKEKNGDLIIKVKKDIIKKNYSELRKEIEKSFSTLKGKREKSE